MKPDQTSTIVKPLCNSDGEPVFSEPWQAQALAIADILVKSGSVTTKEWSKALGAELEKARVSDMPDDQSTYYMSVLSALEKLSVKNLPLSEDEIKTRKLAWEDAYLSTPHGKPVSIDR